MNHTHWIGLAVLFAISLTAVGAIVGYDVWMIRRHGREGSISYAMCELGWGHPLFAFACGMAVGAVVSGLAVHFWCWRT